MFATTVSNLPAEIAHILEEIRDKDLKFYEIRKRIQQRDNQIHKFIRTNGSLAENPKEQSAYPKIRNDFERAAKLQNEKCDLAVLGLYAISKHLRKLQDKVKTLEDEGYVPPEEILTDHSKQLCEEISNHTINPTATTPIDFSILSEDLSEHNPLLQSMLYAAQTSAVNGTGISPHQLQNGAINGHANGAIPSSTSASSLPSGYRNPAAALNHSLHQHLTNGGSAPNTPASSRQVGGATSAGRGANGRHSRASTGGSQASHTRKHSTLAYSRSATPGNASSREGSVSDIGNGSASSNLTKEKSSGSTAANLAAGSGSANNLNLTPTGRPSKRQKVGHGGAAAANQGASGTTKSSAGGSSGRQSVKVGSYASSRNATPSDDRGSNSAGATANTKSRKSSSGSSATDAKHAASVDEALAGDSAEIDADTSIVQEGEDKVYCVCRQVSFGNMVACDNDECPYEWFHWDCVGLVEPPQGTWYCPTCTKAMKEKETKKRSRS